MISARRSPLAARAAFTLIETLIVVGVTALLTGVILTYTSTSRDRLALSVEETKLAQTISRAKALSLATYNRPTIPCGYGVSLDYEAERYELFAYDVPQCNDIHSLDPAKKIDREFFVLPPNVHLGEGEARLEHILFIPPDPDTLLWRFESSATSTFGNVYLENRPGSPHAKIQIGLGGQISF